jgi:hypothetical protein
MHVNKSLDEIELITALFRDICKNHDGVFNTVAVRNTVKRVRDRVTTEGLAFLTKSLPRLGKALDKALSCETPLNAAELGFKPKFLELEHLVLHYDAKPMGADVMEPLSRVYYVFGDHTGKEFVRILQYNGKSPLYPWQFDTWDPIEEPMDVVCTFDRTSCRGLFKTMLPMFMFELFERVLHPDGSVRSDADPKYVRIIRQVCYLFYKYELPYSDEQENQVINSFKQTEEDLVSVDRNCLHTSEDIASSATSRGRRFEALPQVALARKIRRTLHKVFAGFDPRDILPNHGPGVVSTKETSWEKYVWSNIPARVTAYYPWDSYFTSSLGAVCDHYRDLKVGDKENPARVCLVPKDSRGPRLISCEPVALQWVQQGLRKALYRHVEERCELTRANIFFTNQQPNSLAALIGSRDGRYATLDLKEASDRVSMQLVRLLFPGDIVDALEATRSLSTELPNGEVLTLRKFAPMGSALCFPIMAITIWSILDAAAPDVYTRERILVYGDDVIVPQQFAADAITSLELFGLRVNRDKSCTKGLFRESCGTDAFKGVNVTPLKLKTVWTSEPSPESFESWVAYARRLFHDGYIETYEYIVRCLNGIYWPIADDGLHTGAPSLPYNPEQKSIPSRYNARLQKTMHLVTVVSTRKIKREIPGWSKLLRYFTETSGVPMSQANRIPPYLSSAFGTLEEDIFFQDAGSVSEYTERHSSILERRWR